ncbi:hypothetical protein [Corynebacterium sp. NML130628]|uniref:hypothetical protein n=1 Tax=Corynebacterium sp. NML130628 TaxID=1906333 RepID=UPI0008FB2335|nr:hypothetical protein [Corynebacterium sp. NML130628]OIR44422.1 hypothetical protein BJP07_05475 [Corynebacterium sp. NML130628]
MVSWKHTACSALVAATLMTSGVSVAQAQEAEAGVAVPTPTRGVYIQSQRCQFRTDGNGNVLVDARGQRIPVLDEHGKPVCEDLNASSMSSLKQNGGSSVEGKEKLSWWGILLIVLGSIVGVALTAFWLTFEQANIWIG